MNRDVVFSIGIGFSTLGVMRMFFEIPGEFMAGVAIYTAFMTLGQHLIRIDEIINYESWVRPAKAFGTTIISGSVALTMIIVLIISTKDQQFIDKSAEIFTLIALGTSIISISTYEK